MLLLSFESKQTIRHGDGFQLICRPGRSLIEQYTCSILINFNTFMVGRSYSFHKRVSWIMGNLSAQIQCQGIVKVYLFTCNTFVLKFHLAMRLDLKHRTRLFIRNKELKQAHSPHMYGGIIVLTLETLQSIAPIEWEKMMEASSYTMFQWSLTMTCFKLTVTHHHSLTHSGLAHSSHLFILISFAEGNRSTIFILFPHKIPIF